MTDSHSDALVFYGVTGDLAFKKIFPALQAMVKLRSTQRRKTSRDLPRRAAASF